MMTNSDAMTKSVEILVESARECAALARTQHIAAERQHESASRQYENANKLTEVSKALVKDAAELRAELRLAS